MEKEAKRSWDRKILEMVQGLLLAEATFQEVFKKYKKGTLYFSDIENWVDDKGHSLLYNLKEQCHSFFRSGGKRPVKKNEWLLDLAIGSIFHEAMKLRENLYQMEVYRPKYLQFKRKRGKSDYEQDYLRHFERIISKTEQGILDGMEETRSLFLDAMAQLIDFFKKNSTNPLLARFLLEHQPLLKKVYGPKKAEEVFSLMFKKGFFDAYVLVGQSYLQSEHYDLSAFYFSKAIKMDPDHRCLQSLLHLSLGMNDYFNNHYSKSILHFEKTLQLGSKTKIKKEYLRKMGEVCHKISFELEEEEAPEAARKARLIVEQIEKC